MLSIQDAGTEILGDKPRSLYIFGGNEYGIKVKYIEHLSSFYQKSQDYDTVADVLAIFKKKQLIPLQPKLYIVRYDDSFITDLSERFIKQFSKLKIVGTIVCLYENVKAVNKCNKYLPDNTVLFEPVNPVFIKQYLQKDFPELSEKAISEAIRLHSDYMGAYNICIGLNTLSNMDIESITSEKVDETFGYNASASDIQLRHAFASKNLYACSELLDKYESDKNQVFYVWLSTMLELEKLITNPKQKSDLNKYVKQWDIMSVYNMFMQIYHQLDVSRSVTYYNIDDGLLYVALLLQYETVPALGVI